MVKTSLKNNHSPLGISKYKILEELPEYLERKLNEGKKISNFFNKRKDKKYGKGYSKRNLRYMSSFANEFNKDEILQQPAAQIP